MSYRIHAQKRNTSPETGTSFFTHIAKNILQCKSSNDSEHAEVPPIVHDVLNSPGQPLDENTRSFMESRLGHDFSKVRVHTDSKAAESAQAVNALAYTVGKNIAFDTGQYTPMTNSGKQILAHELAHVIQQNQSSFTLSPVMEIPLEQSANEASEKILQGHSIIDVAGKSSAGLILQKAPRKCEPFYGPPNQPDTVSRQIIDRWMGKYAKEGDPGEGCREEPYVAGKTEKVCTIGFGHQIPGCLVLSRATGDPPNAEEIAKVKNVKTDLKCACEGTEHFDCKGKQAENQLLMDAQGAINHIHKIVPINLTQAEFDALVDISLHSGHLPENILEALKLYWCTDEGMDYVRDIYLKTNLEPFKEAFAKRRAFRVWPRRIAPVQVKKDAPVDLWKISQKALADARNLQGDSSASEESKRAALNSLWKAIGSIEQRQKTGFRNDEERITILELKRQLLQMIGEYMDAMSRGAP